MCIIDHRLGSGLCLPAVALVRAPVPQKPPVARIDRVHIALAVIDAVHVLARWATVAHAGRI